MEKQLIPDLVKLGQWAIAPLPIHIPMEILMEDAIVAFIFLGLFAYFIYTVTHPERF